MCYPKVFYKFNNASAEDMQFIIYYQETDLCPGMLTFN